MSTRAAYADAGSGRVANHPAQKSAQAADYLLSLALIVYDQGELPTAFSALTRKR